MQFFQTFKRPMKHFMMNYKGAFNILIIIILVSNFTTAKPLIMKNYEYTKEFPTQLQKVIKSGKNLHSGAPKLISSVLHKLTKRDALAFGKKSSSKTGFAAIITSPQEKGVAKNIECLDWEEQPMIGKWECIKFIIKKN